MVINGILLPAGREIRWSAAMNINHDLDDFQETERVLGQCVPLQHCIVIVYYFFSLLLLLLFNYTINVMGLSSFKNLK